MSNFHFLKKDLEWKIVNLQCWGPHSPHNPHNPTMAPYHRSRKQLYTLAPWHRARSALIPFPTFIPPSPSLFYTRSREKISLYWESRNEWQIEIWVTSILAHLHHTLRLLAHLIFSLQLSFKRENYTPTIIPPFGEVQKWVTNWDMSRKSF